MTLIIKNLTSALRSASGVALFTVLFGVLSTSMRTSAETLAEWQVQNLPANLNGVSTVRLPTNPIDAANTLVYKLENEGYPLAEVRIASDRLIVTYGEITEVSVVGLKPSVEALIHGYMDHLVGTSPTTDQLSHAISLINDIPGLSASVFTERVDELGHYRAIVQGEQKDQAGVVSLRNTPTEEFSSREIALHQEFYSSFLGGDITRIDLTAIDTDSDSEGQGVQLSYEFPINALGTFVETRLSHFKAQGESEFEAEQAPDAEVTNAALVIGHAFERRVEQADYLYGELDYRHEKSKSTGTKEFVVGRATFFESYHGDHGTTLAWSVSLAGGSGLSGEEEKFGHLRAGGGLIFWLPSISDTAEMRIEGSLQLGSTNVPDFELFSFSGSERQRGFEPYQYAGNHGAELTIEVADTFRPSKTLALTLTPYAFLDATYIENDASNVSESRPRHNQLFSAGVGSKFTFFNGLSIDSWLGVPLHDGQESDLDRNVAFYIQSQYTW